MSHQSADNILLCVHSIHSVCAYSVKGIKTSLCNCPEAGLVPQVSEHSYFQAIHLYLMSRV